MKNKKRDEKWNDNLDLYVDDVRVGSAPMSSAGFTALKDMAQAMMRSGVLFQIKFRDAVQWESIPTQIEDEPEGGWPRCFDLSIL